MHVTGFRTTLRPGAEEEYSDVHSRIPDEIAAALRTAGVVSWRIWRDGRILFHSIETIDGRDGMLANMANLGPIDPVWDRKIAELVDSAEHSRQELPLIWALTCDGQSSGIEHEPGANPVIVANPTRDGASRS
ncbi:L-rhamnose mutarotase (plasmid) [Coraliomargarita sp. W4R53]